MVEKALATTVRAVDATTSIIGISGSVTAASESALMDAYLAASGERTKRVVLDFRELEYLNSSGIGLVVTMLVRAKRAGQQLAAFGLTDHYRHIFELTRLNDAIAIHEDESSALGVTAS